MRIRACVFLCLTFGSPRNLTANPFYSVTDLGTPYAYGINNKGQIAGGSFGPFIYSGGQLTFLSNSGTGRSINDAGQVTGDTSFNFAEHAFLYSNGQLLDLGPPGFRYSRGSSVNNLGEVTGVSQMDGPYEHAFLYRNGQMLDLGTLGAGASYGKGINNFGQVTGQSDTSTFAHHAFLYSNGQMIDLGTLGGSDSDGIAINESGQVTGGADVSSGAEHAFLYSNGKMTDLGLLEGLGTIGFGLNDLAQVVGYSFTIGYRSQPVPFHAFVYTHGELLDLNDLIDPALRVTLTDAYGINDSGQIVADGSDPAGNRSGFLLTPTAIPEPSTAALFGLPVLALLALRSWRMNP